jgi:hypothetical protein
VIEQENSGFLVPLIVRRCIMEVEKRGLDIIGEPFLQLFMRFNYEAHFWETVYFYEEINAYLLDSFLRTD